MTLHGFWSLETDETDVIMAKIRDMKRVQVPGRGYSSWWHRRNR